MTKKRKKPRSWTAKRVRALGITTTVETAAEILGIGRSKAYALAKDGDFPVNLVRIGRRYVVPVPALLRLLEADDPAPTDAVVRPLRRRAS